MGLLGFVPSIIKSRANSIALIRFDLPEALAPYIMPALSTFIPLYFSLFII